MNIAWRPSWFGLDQTTIAKDTDYFYLSKHKATFANEEASSEDQEVYAEVLRIAHPELGEVQGILTEGLSYWIFICEENFVQIDAEENIGEVEHPTGCRVSEWDFEIELSVQKITGFSSLDRTKMMTEKEHLAA